uniref:Uncharacterized protein n=1 Tax=viral metagenome TaxID=1070528 RepID=A0A6C0CDD3_9ZZZZ
MVKTCKRRNSYKRRVNTERKSGSKRRVNTKHKFKGGKLFGKSGKTRVNRVNREVPANVIQPRNMTIKQKPVSFELMNKQLFNPKSKNNPKFGQQFNILFSSTNISELNNNCPTDKDNIYNNLTNNIEDYSYLVKNGFGASNIWTIIYLGNYINEKPKAPLGKGVNFVSHNIDQVNTPLLPGRAATYLNNSFGIDISSSSNYALTKGVNLIKFSNGYSGVSSGFSDDDFVYEGSYDPNRFIELIMNKKLVDDKKPFIVTHSSLIFKMLSILQSKFSDGWKRNVEKVRNLDCLKIYYSRKTTKCPCCELGDVQGIAKIELYSSGTWSNPLTYYDTGEINPESGLIIMRHCPACHNTTTLLQALKKRGLSGIVSNCLPITIEFLLGISDKIDYNSITNITNHFNEDTLNNIKRFNLQSIDKKKAELNSLMEEEISMNRKDIRKIRMKYKQIYLTLNILQNYWVNINLEQHIKNLNEYAKERRRNLYKIVFDNKPTDWIPISSCSFRTCLTTILISHSLYMVYKENETITSTLQDDE